MKMLRFVRRLTFALSGLLILGFFGSLLGGGKLLELWTGRLAKPPLFMQFLVLMPLAVLGTLTETIRHPQDKALRWQTIQVTFVLAGLFAAAAFCLFTINRES